jgi:hypothetical protein
MIKTTDRAGKARSPSWLGKLNGGQLDVMWQFLQFHGDKPTVKEIEALEENLDLLRVMMVQKNGGQEGQNTKTKGGVDFADMETVLNNIIIETMWLYLGGGLKMLKEVIQGAEC